MLHAAVPQPPGLRALELEREVFHEIPVPVGDMPLLRTKDLDLTALGTVGHGRGKAHPAVGGGGADEEMDKGVRGAEVEGRGSAAVQRAGCLVADSDLLQELA